MTRHRAGRKLRPAAFRWLTRSTIVVGLAMSFVAGPTFTLPTAVTLLAGAALLRPARG